MEKEAGFVVEYASGLPVAIVMTEDEAEAIRKFAKSEGLDEEEVKKLAGDAYAFVKVKVLR